MRIDDCYYVYVLYEKSFFGLLQGFLLLVGESATEGHELLFLSGLLLDSGQFVQSWRQELDGVVAVPPLSLLPVVDVDLLLDLLEFDFHLLLVEIVPLGKGKGPLPISGKLIGTASLTV
jgi:hypothetical protein